MLLKLSDICVAFGDKALLDHVNLTLLAGQRIGLLGRNGEGKSTLLKAIKGLIPTDEGDIKLKQGGKVAMLAQSPNLNLQHTIFDAVTEGFGEPGKFLSQYQHLLNDDNIDDATRLERMGDIQHKIEQHNAWNLNAEVEKTLSRLDLPPNELIANLSGGWRRRVNLAQALVSDPDILLLDEPTNHLDIETIEWMETLLTSFTGGILLVTHDRKFLQNVCTDIADLERGQLTLWPGNYQDYLRRKQAALDAEQRANAEFDKKLAQEETWIRQGIKARRTRNEGRVRALQAMREQHAQRRQRQGNAKLQIDTKNKSGKLVIEATDVTFGYPNKVIAKNFSCDIHRGDRIGILGPNGIGKSTIIKTLLNELAPLSGTIRHGTQLDFAYFDQLRAEINPDDTVIDAVSQGKNEITINGKTKHVISYLSDFLFTPARARSPIKSLSGGERARVLLARLFSKPFNFLIMDEPTNDLDIETLELLEDLLMQFDGTLILISHDRDFIDHVVTTTWAINNSQQIDEQIGGYTDWQRQRPVTQKANANKSGPTKSDKMVGVDSTPSTSVKKKKLSYNQQRELELLPKRIEELEQQQQKLSLLTSASDFYQQPQDKVASLLKELDTINTELDACYAKWEELEG